MENILNILTSLGIEKQQAQVYLAALELGSASVADVAKKAKVKRTSVYNFLDEMKKAGLVSEIKQGKKILLVPENPQNLARIALRNMKAVETALPELLGIFNLPAGKPKVRFYEGDEGVRATYADLVETGETVYGFSDYEKMFDSFPEVYLWSIPEERKKHGVKFFCIAKNGPRGREVKRRDESELRETKLVENVAFDTEINIYANKVAMISFRRPYACVIVEDAAIAQTLKSVWKSWWTMIRS